MSEKPMTEKEYLRVRGWRGPSREWGGWTHLRLSVAQGLPTAKAVAAQLEEDRRVLAFVLARSPSLSIGDDVFGSAAFARTSITYLDETLAEGEVNEDV